MRWRTWWSPDTLAPGTLSWIRRLVHRSARHPLPPSSTVRTSPSPQTHTRCPHLCVARRQKWSRVWGLCSTFSFLCHWEAERKHDLKVSNTSRPKLDISWTKMDSCLGSLMSHSHLCRTGEKIWNIFGIFLVFDLSLTSPSFLSQKRKAGKVCDWVLVVFISPEIPT